MTKALFLCSLACILVGILLVLLLTNPAQAQAKTKNGWSKQRSYQTLYYVSHGREHEKKVKTKVKCFYKNGKRVKNKWIDGKYLDRQGIMCATKQPTLKSYLTTAIKPVGKVAYVWGGGWPSTTSRGDVRMGLSKKWKKFYNSAGKDYDFRNYIYRYSKGLDCSGFVGWALYNATHTKAKGRSFTTYASKTGVAYVKQGFGKKTKSKRSSGMRPGDVMYNRRHVWISLGTCADGSVLVLHSSPSGVQVNGTPTPSGKKKSDAVKLSKKVMNSVGGWKFSVPVRDYLGEFYRFRWSLGQDKLMSDPDGWRSLSAEEIAGQLFGVQ